MTTERQTPKCQARAFGKVILLGEHAVVYGEPALAGALNTGCDVTTEPHPEGPCLVIGENRFFPHEQRSSVERAFAAVLRATGLEQEKILVKARFDIPTSAGLGSSAALAVALSRSLFAHTGKEADDAAVSGAITAVEAVFHGNPSGLDALLARHGGLGLYRRLPSGPDFETLQLTKPLRLIIADTGVQRSTEAQVAKVRDYQNRAAKLVDPIMKTIGAVVHHGAEALKQHNWQALGQMMNINHGLLASLDLSNGQIETLVHTARAHGALGAKLTGAGGGGCVIALALENEEAVCRALRPLAKSVLVAELGAST